MLAQSLNTAEHGGQKNRKQEKKEKEIYVSW